jgi:RNA polymerase sigma-70 factor (ECF subfamily)
MRIASDGELWEQTRRGEATALGELYERHAGWVHCYCIWRTAAKQLAEDVAATAFLEAWRRRRRLELTTRSAAPLLLGVATEVLRGYWRTQRRHARALERIAQADLSAWDEDEAAARVHLIAEVREAGAPIRAFPPREREVLALLLWGGLSEDETAAALGVGVETVRSRAERSRSRLEGRIELPDISLLLPRDSVLAARRPALEAGCGLAVRGLLVRAFS